MTTIPFGKTAAGAPFTVPLEIVTQSIAILAKRGSGKTYTANVLAEGLLTAGQQVIVMDPTGAWWGLKSSADGSKPGFPIVIFGGDHADIPLAPDAGEAIAAAILEHGLSAVIDLSHFRKHECVRFVTAFAETLYRQCRTALHLIVDEADAVAPQRAMHDEARMLGAMEDIVRRGRIRGLGCTLITQRPQVLNKNVLTQCEILVCLRLGHPKDIAAIKDWVAVHADESQAQEIIRSLPSLPIGTGWFWSPGWVGICERVEIRKRTTFDSSATPKPGEARVLPKQIAKVDIEALGGQIAETIERVKAEDPKALRARIKELEAEREKSEGSISLEDLEAAKRSGAAIANLVWGDRLQGIIKPAATKFYEGVALLEQLFAEQAGEPIVLGEAVFHPGEVPTSAPRPPKIVRPPSTVKSTAPTGGMGRMMIALAQRPAGLTRRQLGLRAGLSSKSGTFSTYIGRLRSSGWLSDDSNGSFFLTKAGLAALGDFEPLPSGHALLEFWKGELGAGSGAARMLDALRNHYPRAIARDHLGQQAGISPKSGTFSTYLGRLKGLELIVTSGSEIRLSEELA